MIVNRDSDEEIDNRRLRSENARLRAELAASQAKMREMGEEGRRMTDEIERLATTVERVLQEVRETISAQRGYNSASIEDYFRDYKRVRVLLYAKDVAKLQAALSPDGAGRTEEREGRDVNNAKS